MAKPDVKDLDKRLSALEKQKNSAKIDKLDKIVDAMVVSLKDPKLFKAMGLLDDETATKLVDSILKTMVQKLDKEQEKMIKDLKDETRLIRIEARLKVVEAKVGKK